MRSPPVRSLVAGLLLSTGCAGGGPATPPPPPPLAYGMPSEPTAVYIQGDTATFTVDAGGETVEVEVASSARYAMDFAPAEEGGVRVEVHLRRVEGSVTNPLGPPQRIDEEELGSIVLHLSRTGLATLVSAPDLPSEVATFISAPLFAETFFPRLPGRAVPADRSWTDTVSVEVDEEEARLGVHSVMTYTTVGDTVVEGRPHMLVRTHGRGERSFSGPRAGMEISQELSSTSEGWFVWDPLRRLPREIRLSSEATGTMEVSLAPFPLPIRAESTTRIVLVEPEPGG